MLLIKIIKENPGCAAVAHTGVFDENVILFTVLIQRNCSLCTAS